MIPLQKAAALAAKVAAELAPYCARVEVAGSIRRERPECGDIDLVILPHAHRGLELLNAGVQHLITPTEDGQKSGLILTNGNAAKRVLLRASQIQCDLWIADHGIPASGDLFGTTPAIPGNWGALMLTYTGSVAHNIHIVESARDRGWIYKPTRGLIIPGANADTPPEVLSLDEREILTRLFGHFIDPQNRD